MEQDWLAVSWAGLNDCVKGWVCLLNVAILQELAGHILKTYIHIDRYGAEGVRQNARIVVLFCCQRKMERSNFS